MDERERSRGCCPVVAVDANVRVQQRVRVATASVGAGESIRDATVRLPDANRRRSLGERRHLRRRRAHRARASAFASVGPVRDAKRGRRARRVPEQIVRAVAAREHVRQTNGDVPSRRRRGGHQILERARRDASIGGGVRVVVVGVGVEAKVRVETRVGGGGGVRVRVRVGPGPVVVGGEAEDAGRSRAGWAASDDGGEVAGERRARGVRGDSFVDDALRRVGGEDVVEVEPGPVPSIAAEEDARALGLENHRGDAGGVIVGGFRRGTREDGDANARARGDARGVSRRAEGGADERRRRRGAVREGVVAVEDRPREHLRVRVRGHGLGGEARARGRPARRPVGARPDAEEPEARRRIRRRLGRGRRGARRARRRSVQLLRLEELARQAPLRHALRLAHVRRRARRVARVRPRSPPVRRDNDASPRRQVMETFSVGITRNTDASFAFASSKSGRGGGVEVYGGSV